MSELDALKELLPISGTGIALAGVTFGLAKYLNETLSEDIRTQVALWFYGDAPTFSWHQFIPRLFDRIFGERIWSWKCLRRVFIYNVALSPVLLSVVTLIIVRCNCPASMSKWEMARSWWEYGFLYAVTISLPLDYVCIAKTRILLKSAGRYTHSPGLLISAAFVDLLGTALIIYIAFLL